MKINPSIEIEDMDGLPIPIVKVSAVCPHCKKQMEVDQKISMIVTNTNKNITLKSVCVNALLDEYEDEPKLSGMDKQKRGKLADKIYAAKDDIDLTPKEISLLQDLIGKKNKTLTVTRAYELLDPTEEKENEEDKPAKNNNKKKAKATKKSN